jgi:hypothetical protein
LSSADARLPRLLSSSSWTEAWLPWLLSWDELLLPSWSESMLRDRERLPVARRLALRARGLSVEARLSGSREVSESDNDEALRGLGLARAPSGGR